MNYVLLTWDNKDTSKNNPEHKNLSFFNGGAKVSTGVGSEGGMPEWAGSETKPILTNADTDVRYALAA